jgi:hypothetical protein
MKSREIAILQTALGYRFQRSGAAGTGSDPQLPGAGTGGRISPLEFWMKPLAELTRFTRWWVDLVRNAGSMQLHTLIS